MQANFDGMRRNATANMNTLGKFLEEEILNMDSYDMPSELKEKLIEAGFDDYISKPIAKNQLLKVVEKYIILKDKNNA